MLYFQLWEGNSFESVDRFTKKILSKYKVELIGATKSVIEKAENESF